MQWLTSQNRKRHQRAMNKLVRIMNRNIENDSLWLGRFYAKQIAAEWVTYEDHSGAELWVTLQFVDKKTGCDYKAAGTVNHWRYFNGSNLWWSMNEFIVDRVGVWSENPQPSISNAVDYRNK